MPNVYIPPNLASAFLQFLEAQPAALPPTLTELQTRFKNALAPSPTTAEIGRDLELAGSSSSRHLLTPALPQTSTSSQQRTVVRRVAPLPRRSRAHSLPLEATLSDLPISPSAWKPLPFDFIGRTTNPPLFFPSPQNSVISLSPSPSAKSSVTSPCTSYASSPTVRAETISPYKGLKHLYLPQRIEDNVDQQMLTPGSDNFLLEPDYHDFTLGPLYDGHRFLSPLDIQDEDEVQSVLGKHSLEVDGEDHGDSNGEDHGVNGEEDDGDDDDPVQEREEREQDRSRPNYGEHNVCGRRTNFSITIPAPGVGRRCPVRVRSPCPRKGAAKRKKAAQSSAAIGHMSCGDAGCQDCGQETSQPGVPPPSGGGRQTQNSQGSRSKKTKTSHAWRTDPDGGPAVTEGAGKLLSDLLQVFGRMRRLQLEDILAGYSVPSLQIPMSTDISSTIDNISALIGGARINEVHLMISLLQLALNVDSVRAQNAMRGLPRKNVTDVALAEKYAPRVHKNTFREWLNHGKKLAMLCAGGTLYILPIIAALDMRIHVLRRVSEEDILCFASALRRVKHGLWLPMVRRLMVPVFYMQESSGYIQSLRLQRMVPKREGEESQTETFGFMDVASSDRILDSLVTQYPVLHSRSSEWNASTTPAWKPQDDPGTLKMPALHTIHTPLQYEKTPTPVTKRNRNDFTESQRKLAERAPRAENLEDLQRRVNVLHEGGKTKLGEYVKIDSDILQGQALKITDANDKLLSLLFTVPKEYRQQLQDAIGHIHTCMPNEFVAADSSQKHYSFLACHYSWLARYGEDGTGAPEGVHPDEVRRDHQGRVNFSQRTPHRTKEMKDMDEYQTLVEAYTDFFELLRVALKAYLPEEYDELSIYVEQLPLDASSPCYPFGGFVVNLRACTWAHRDGGDKKLCLVIPFGDFTGGELCLYETGFCFNLKLGDVLAFPSCDLTHFNLHFRGLRGTLVLHSDKEGDRWVADRNGWASSMIRHT